MRHSSESRSRKPLVAALVTLWGCAAAAVAGPPGPTQDWVTLSVLATAPSAELTSRETRVSLTVPDCPAGTEFLVLGVAGGPSVNSAADGGRAAAVGTWSVYARINQRISAPIAQFEQKLVAFGNGAAYASASLPAGQPATSSATSTQMVVGVLGYGDYKGGVSRFRIDVTGACGTFSVR
jgi:hypothetical protein